MKLVNEQNLIWNKWILYKILIFKSYLFYYIYIFKDESKVLSYFGNVSHNSVTADAFAKFVEKTTTLYCKMPSLPDTLQVLLTWFASLTRIHGFRPTWPCLIIKVLATWVKFLEQSGYCTVINFAFTFHSTNDFSCFYGVML